MAWEKRGRGHYFYFKERRGNRVVSKYAGNGPGVEKLVSLSEELRDIAVMTRKLKRRDMEILRDEQEFIDDPVQKFEEAMQPYIKAFFISNGYHFYRGEWRKTREFRNK